MEGHPDPPVPYRQIRALYTDETFTVYQAFSSAEITRAGLRWALEHACLSHYEPGTYAGHTAWRHRLRTDPAGSRTRPAP
jgi:hypothetical protein